MAVSLLKLMERITRHPRQRIVEGTNFDWSASNWTHNVFRSYETLFGRRYGKNGVGDTIRIEMSAAVTAGGKVVYAAHTFEAACALTEQMIRQALKWRLSPVRVYIPILMTPQGIPFSASPYLFAIAVDTTGSGKNAVGSPLSYSFTGTGSNLALMVGCFGGVAAGTDSCSWNSTTITLRNSASSGRFCYLFGALVTAATSNIVITLSVADTIVAVNASYSGVTSVTAGSNGTGTGTSITAVNTTSADNSWTVMFTRGNGAVSAGASTTMRKQSPTDSDTALFDSNAAITPAGSNTLTATSGSGLWVSPSAIIAPFVASGPANVKIWDGITQSTGIKTYGALALGSTKTVNGVA